MEKAFLTKLNPYDPAHIPVMFNPAEYTVTKDMNFARASVPGLNAPLVQFVNGNAQTLEMELFLDTYELHSEGATTLNQRNQDVRALTRQLTDLMNADPITHAPPVLLFTWSSLTFTCVLLRASQRFVMFQQDGTPVRARLQVTFGEYSDPDFQAQQQKNQTADYSKLYVVKQDETLSGIAAQVYDNAALWRPIALANNLDDPRTLAIGQKLLIPRLPFRDPQTGEVMQ